MSTELKKANRSTEGNDGKRARPHERHASDGPIRRQHNSRQRSLSTQGAEQISREELIELLNEDLSREYQAIIAYVVYSQVLKGPEYMSIAGELERHAAEELKHALVIAKQIDYLGGIPTVEPKPVVTSEDAEEMLRSDLENENDTVLNYRQRVRQCEALGEYGMAEHIREILMAEQEHQIDLAAALGKHVSEVTTADERT
jgi:bacterioferritin